MTISEITRNDLPDWLEMALVLWPEDTPENLRWSLESFLVQSKYMNFICKTGDGIAAGFIDLSIRTDYVEGTSGSPVVFIEGIYVKPAYRRQGIARKLMQAGEEWGRQMGCVEMGSDAYADNLDSRKFHTSAGFMESAPIVVFMKKI